jgi:chlorophyllide a reductase subunit Y
LLIESGADVPYVGTACPKTAMSQADLDWLADKGTVVKFRASLEDDLAAVDAFEPDLAIGTTPLVQAVKEKGRAALYFTNLVSARPLMGPAGAGSLAQVINTTIGNTERMSSMREFFDGVGHHDTAGIWEGSPNLRPDFRALNQKKIEKAARAAKAQEMI